MHLQVGDADAAYERVVAAGCRVVMPLADQFWGDRYAILEDPFGHRSSIGASIRND
jgi:PhnB protein